MAHSTWTPSLPGARFAPRTWNPFPFVIVVSKGMCLYKHGSYVPQPIISIHSLYVPHYPCLTCPVSSVPCLLDHVNGPPKGSTCLFYSWILEICIVYVYQVSVDRPHTSVCTSIPAVQQSNQIPLVIHSEYTLNFTHTIPPPLFTNLLLLFPSRVPSSATSRSSGPRIQQCKRRRWRIC